MHLMNRTRKAILLAMMSIFLLGFTASERPMEQQSALMLTNPCEIENHTFQSGEEIVYKLYYNWNFVWLSAGEVTFQVKETDHHYRLTAIGRTYKSYEWFYKVRDRYDSYIDKNNLLPSTSIREIQEGGYRLYDKTTLDQNRGLATCVRGRNRNETKTQEHEIENCIHDVLSIIYYARNLDFEALNEGDEFPIKIFLDAKTYPLQVKYKGKEAKKNVKGMGKYKTIVFSPQLIAGQTFDKGAEMNIWVTDDQNRVPVLIESPLSVGSVKAVLKSHKGLKYEVTAQL